MKKHLIIAAMDSEFSELVKADGFTCRTLPQTDVVLWERSRGRSKITVAKTGVGPISAAMILTQILSEATYTDVLLLGLGGGLDSRLTVGDVVIADRVIQHDAICTFDDRTEIMACGDLHLSLAPEKRKSIFMMPDQSLNIKYHEHLSEQSFQVFQGDLLSGSEFVGALERKNNLKSRFPTATLVDMEACAVAYICTHRKIPFAVVKTVADTLHPQASRQYLDYVQSSAQKCVELISFLENSKNAESAQ
ncbi:MAG: hypothetical protein OM95_14795 [Bdellovibrio sp. ArHS]|uniref:5'-methylthioadenosine/S-adenosylhomocysteine nucleosidase n=1 Tax=Bdellovibrio sp. ArHS TaxID=1569284 RepID=UPI0005832EA7|nr:5'-methylthioadenosine/S-adenosylhomocysteine nucleosidase [Bdellovibrio sp. ArHS]KHD87364.1 MAG: hypothetical protein OM95_14795 [Bdellovibrio sp. ArHS]